MNYSDDEIIALLNRLLEKLHQADGKNQSSIVLNVYKEGSQHVDHVDKQYFGYTPTPPKEVNKETDVKSQLPEELRTEEAMKLWKIAQDAGYVDAHYQPTISHTLSALLAQRMAGCLKLKNKWKVFEKLWNRKGMYKDYYKALNQKQSYKFIDTIKNLII